MRRFFSLFAIILCVSSFPASLFGATASINSDHRCGTDPDGVLTDLFRHRQAQQRRARLQAAAALPDTGAPAYVPDIGSIAIVDDSEGAVIRPNVFDLQQRLLRFTPAGSGAQYTAAPAEIAFDADAAQNGAALTGLGDDDSRLVRLPFSFPFYGQRHDSMYVNSDGNLSFTQGDDASTPRSLGRVLSGPPRICPFFSDLDPSQPDGAVRYFAAGDRAVVTWDNVPQWVPRGIGSRQTFQVALYPDGRIEYNYRGITIDDAVVGVAPGALRNGSTPTDLSGGLASPASGAIAEIFSSITAVDFVAVAQKFYRNHDDIYDYIVLFNNLGFTGEDSPLAFASERGLRNQVLGIGKLLRQSPIFDSGADFGSALRLQSFVNMGPLSNYPSDPKQVIPVFASSRNTPLTVLGQESGHRFLAYVRYLDPQTNRPSAGLLGRDAAHWSFFFNTDASVVEGNRIEDLGEGQSPRFRTTATVEHYGPFDQYIMGMRGPDEVPPSFLVRNPSAGFAASASPRANVTFDGTRQDITVQMIVDAEGKRIPDATVAQKHFSYAFVLLTQSGAPPSAEDLSQIDRLRAAWEDFFGTAVENRGSARTALVKRLLLSTWPTGGVLRGSAASATVSITAPLASALNVQLSADSGTLTVPPSVAIPAGQTSATFSVTGVRQGVSELTATASAPFEVSRTLVQVREDPAQLRVEVVSGGNQQGGRGTLLSQPVVFRVRDENNVPFSGVKLVLTPSGDGAVSPSSVTTDPLGRASVQWKLASAGAANTLRVSIDGAASAGVSVNATAGDLPVFSAAGVVNAASFNLGAAASNTALAPGSLVAIFGGSLAASTAIATSLPLPVKLASTSVTVNGVAAPLIFVSPSQINLQLPFELSGQRAEVIVSNGTGPSAPLVVQIGAVQPGIFFDPASGQGAIVQNTDGKLTSDRPARAGDFLQIYGTGLGAVSPIIASGLAAPASPLSRTTAQPQVTIGGRPAQVTFSGLAPGFAGLYVLTVQVPEGVGAGRQNVSLTINGQRSNEVSIVAAGAAGSVTPE